MGKIINPSITYHAAIAWKYKKLTIAILLLVPIVLITERYLAPIIIAWLIDGIQHKTIDLDNAMPAIGLYLMTQITTQVIGYRLILWLIWKLQVKGSIYIYQSAYHSLMEKSLGFYADNFAGAIVSKLNRLSGAYLNSVNSAVYQAGFSIVSVVATLIGIGILLWQYSIALALLVCIFTALAFWGAKVLGPKYKKRSEVYNDISAQLADSFGNIALIKSDGGQIYEEDNFHKTLRELDHRETGVRNSFIKITSGYSSIVAAMRVAVIIASVWAAQHINLDVAKIYLILTYTFNLIGEVWNINSIFRDYYQIIGDTEDTVKLLNQPSEIKDTASDRISVDNGAILFQDVSFAYDKKSSRHFFKKFNLNVQSGQRVGLVGRSGGGKTTITRLLLRFNDVDSGFIAIDGKDISKVTQASLRQNIAYVPQEPLLFHRSLRENIAYSKPDASDAEIRRAAKQSHALEFIEQLPDGFDTLVGERGVKLSGGQRQRVAIARAILKDAPILILDEATSALDSESERLIQDALETLMKGRTSIIIAHRLSTIAKLDRIIVLDSGKIVEDGTHQELLKRKGTYAKLWSHQSGGFLED